VTDEDMAIGFVYENPLSDGESDRFLNQMFVHALEEADLYFGD
jgi:hypothetical protein